MAMPIGSGYSVEAQVTGKEVVGGLQFDVTPMVLPKMDTMVGGLIKQCILEDDNCVSSWDRERTITFNVQIVNSEVFRQVTRMDPPETPVDAKAYASLGLPFHEIYIEQSSVKGEFGDIQSVKQLDKSEGSKEANRAHPKTTSHPLNIRCGVESGESKGGRDE